MTQSQLKNAGYHIVQKAADVKCFDGNRRKRLIDAYAEQIKRHETVTATLVQLIALGVIENA